MTLEVGGCRGECTEEIIALTRLAYASYAALDPPSGALLESDEVVRAELNEHGGVVARQAGRLVGALRLQRHDDRWHLRRVAVDPEHRGQGIARAMLDWCVQEGSDAGVKRLTLGVRDQLPANRRVWERLGFTVVAQHAFPPPSQWGWTEMERLLS